MPVQDVEEETAQVLKKEGAESARCERRADFLELGNDTRDTAGVFFGLLLDVALTLTSPDVL